MKKRAHSIAEIRAAIERAGKSPTAIARELGCSRTAVYGYLRDYPELKAAYEKQGGTVTAKEQYPREKFEKAIAGSRGIMQAIADKAGCSRQTLYNALKKWPELAESIRVESEALVDLAESRLVTQVENGEIRAILFTLETKGKDRGWTKRQELTGADGEALLQLSPEALAQAKALGLDVRQIALHFEAMVREMVAQQAAN